MLDRDEEIRSTIFHGPIDNRAHTRADVPTARPDRAYIEFDRASQRRYASPDANVLTC